MIFYGTFISCLREYNFQLLTPKKYFYTKKTSFHTRVSKSDSCDYCDQIFFVNVELSNTI